MTFLFSFKLNKNEYYSNIEKGNKSLIIDSHLYRISIPPKFPEDISNNTPESLIDFFMRART